MIRVEGQAAGNSAEKFQAEPLWLWFVLRFINGAGLALTLVASEFWINALVPERRRGLVTGLYTAVQSIGFVIGPVLLAVIGSRGLLPFAAGTGIMLLAVFPALLGASAAPTTHTSQNRRTVIAFLLATPIATFAAFTFGAIEGGMNLLPIYGMHVGEGERIAILLAAVVALGNLILQVPIGLLSDKVDRRKVLIACASVAVAGACCCQSRPVMHGASSWCFWSGVASLPPLYIPLDLLCLKEAAGEAGWRAPTPRS